MPSITAVPMKAVRLASLSMAFAWGVIGLGIGLNALIKENKAQATLKKSIAAPTVISINVNDIYQPGVIATMISIVIALLSFCFIILILIPQGTASTQSARSRSPLSTRTLPFQFGSLGFFSVWLFTVMVPFTDFYATRSAKVTAEVDGIALPASTISAVEKALGLSAAYNSFDFMKLLAIIPWFTFLFAVIATFVSFLAWRRARSYSSNDDTREGSMVERKIETEA